MDLIHPSHRKPLKLALSPTTFGRMSQTIACTFFYWCHHLNPDVPHTRNNLGPSTVVLRVLTVDTLFSCQLITEAINCELSQVAIPGSALLVPSPGLSNDAKPPILLKEQEFLNHIK